MVSETSDRLMPTFGEAATGLATAPFGGIGYVADQQLNDGKVAKSIDNVADRAGYEMTGVNRNLKKAWNGVSGFFGGIADGASDLAHSPEGNPLMQALAAMGAGILAAKIAPTLFSAIIPGDNFVSNSLRGILGLVLVGLAAYSSAVAVGMVRDDPNYDANKTMADLSADQPSGAPPQKLAALPLGSP